MPVSEKKKRAAAVRRRERLVKRAAWSAGGVAATILLVIAVNAALAPNVVAGPTWDHETTDGERLSSDALRGKVYAVDFFFLTCGICKVQLPENREMAQALADRDDFVFISVTSDPADTTELVNEHRETENATWAHIRDNGHLAREFNVRANPNIVFLDRDGQVRTTVTRITDGETLLHHAKALLDEA